MEEHDETHPYGLHSIQILTSVEAIRKRPAMYIGDVDAGTHVRGFWHGLRDGLTATHGDLSTAELRRRLGAGAAIIVHVGLYDPRLGDPTRDRLDSPEATVAVREVVSRALREDPELLAELRRRAFTA